jgi:hypothetical protein
VIVGSLEVEVLDAGGTAARLEGQVVSFDDNFMPVVLEPEHFHPALIEEPPPPPPPHPALVALEHRYEIIASTADPRYEQFRSVSLGSNGQMAFRATPPDSPE